MKQKSVVECSDETLFSMHIWTHYQLTFSLSWEELMQPSCSCRTAGMRTPALYLAHRVTRTGTGAFSITVASANTGGAISRGANALYAAGSGMKVGNDVFFS